MRPPKGSPIRILRVKPTDDLKTIYAKIRRSFTAADLALYANDDDEMVPAEELLADLKVIHREESRRLKKKKKR